MQQVEEKLDSIEQKIQRVLEQNARYREICTNLLDTKNRLESENESLREQLAQALEQQQQLVQSSNTIVQSSQEEEEDSVDYLDEKEAFKQQINQYIQALDSCVQWIESQS